MAIRHHNVLAEGVHRARRDQREIPARKFLRPVDALLCWCRPCRPETISRGGHPLTTTSLSLSLFLSVSLSGLSILHRVRIETLAAENLSLVPFTPTGSNMPSHNALITIDIAAAAAETKRSSNNSTLGHSQRRASLVNIGTENAAPLSKNREQYTELFYSTRQPRRWLHSSLERLLNF